MIMIATEGSATKVVDTGRLGAAGYVRKPFSADQIKEKPAGILEPTGSQ
jgi:two-component system chemotaxis response regulator CheY